MTLGDRIKQARIKKGLSQTELAEKLGYKSRSSVNKIETGGRDIPRSQIVTIAKILDVTPSYLMGWDTPASDAGRSLESNATILPQEYIRTVPVFRSVSAGFGTYADEQVLGYMPLYIESDEEAAETLVICVEGNSMYPKIEDGDKIQVLRQDWADSGQVAVVMIGDENSVVVKKIVRSEDRVELLSFNPEYPPKVFQGAEISRLRVLGVVKRVIKEL